MNDANSHALDIMAGAISVASRKMAAGIDSVRDHYKALGVPRCGAAVKAVAREVGAALDPILETSLPEAWAAVGDKSAAADALEALLASFLAEGRRHVMAYGAYAGIRVGNSPTPAYLASVDALLDGDRARVRAAIASLRRSGGGFNSPPVPEHPRPPARRRGSAPGPKPDKMAAKLRPLFRQYHEKISDMGSDRQRHVFVSAVWGSNERLRVDPPPARGTVNKHWDSYLDSLG